MSERLSPELPGRMTFPMFPFLRSEWNLSSGDFNAFLAWLNPDRDEAGRKYEDIRRKLIKIFASRGCFCPEDLADETINRVIVKVPRVREGYRGDPACYFTGVARNVFHEYARRRKTIPRPPEPDPPGARSREIECLESCLEDIPESNRRIIVRYFEGKKRIRIENRKGLAHELGTEPNALRIRIHRIRAGLQRCVGDCLARA